MKAFRGAPEPFQLSESPRGTWLAPATLKGHEAKQATVLLAPESIPFRGNELVAGVNVAAIFNDPNQGGRQVIQSLGQTGSLSGQTSFTVDLAPHAGPMGEHTVTLAAFTSTHSVVAHDFELSADSTKTIQWNVCKYPSHCETGRCCNRPEEVAAAEYGACKACQTNCDDCSGYATTITPGQPLPGPCACTEAGQSCYLANNTLVRCESYGNGCKVTRTAARGSVSYEHCP